MEPWYWLNHKSIKFLKTDYLEEGEEPQQRYRDIADAAEKILQIKGFADKFYDYLGRGFYSLSSPVIANFGKKRGCPVSCFNSHVSDNMESILYKAAEVGYMSKIGGGTSGYFGDLRPRGANISTGGTSTGPVHFMQIYDSVTNVVSQSNVRRGSFAAYLPIDHPDIEEFLEIRSEGHPIQNMSFGVCVPDKFIKDMLNGDKQNRKIWAKVIKTRFETGYPYIFFTDNVNKKKPKVYKDLSYQINSSNLCCEVMLPSNDKESFVCVLSSLNLLHWDQIKETDAVETLIIFLDAVNEEFIQKTEKIPFMEHPRNFAVNHRALGMGVLGWHSLLQSKMIPFESFDAKKLNSAIWKEIRERSDAATEQLAKQYGEAPILKGYGRRNVTTLAIAPTTSSSFILGQISPSIEPLDSNYFVKDLAKGKFTYKNPFLKEVLKKHDKDTKETWESILKKGGSVQHLRFLTDEEKEVFKTFSEISQKEVIVQACQRQKHIDQGQSLNLMINLDTPAREVNQLLIFAWENGIKSLYYQKGANPAQKLTRNLLDCKSCEG